MVLTEEEHRPRYSVGQAAQILRTRPRFLHRLDAYEVVRPSRTAGGHRRYSHHELSRIRRVIQLAQEGITLVAIRHIVVLERRVRELEAQRDAAWERLTDRDSRQPRMRRERVPPIPPIVPPQMRSPDQIKAQVRRTRDAEDSPD